MPESQEKPLCYCFNVTADDVRAHFVERGGDYESLVQSTGIGTKCTACLLDLDLVLEGVHQRAARPAHVVATDGPAAFGLRQPKDRADSGFFVCDEKITTVVRLANYGISFNSDSPNVPYDFSIMLISEDGRLVGRSKGRIGLAEETEIDLSQIPGCPPRGWFMISQYPCDEGLFGTLRPQVGLLGKGWAATYHTQPQAMATTERYRFSVVLLGHGGRLSSLVSIINAAPRKNATTLEITDLDGSVDMQRNVELGELGSTFVDLDELFPDSQTGRPMFLSVYSTYPTRKHIINVHDDGSWSLDHFPN